MSPEELIGGASKGREVLDRLSDYDQIDLSRRVPRENLQSLFARIFGQERK